MKARGRFFSSIVIMGIYNYIKGIGSVLDLGATVEKTSVRKYRIHKVLKMSDSQAIGEDWAALGKDMRSAINSVGSKIQGSDHHVREKPQEEVRQ